MDELYLSFLKSTSPFIEKLSDKTLYLRIPSFEMPQKIMIDSLLQKNHDLICSTPNLIIDMRNGTGGSDASYREILPYLYTNPIRRLGGMIYSTELNVQAYEGYSKLFKDTSSSNEIKRIAGRMRENQGKYISIWNKPFEIDTLEKVLPFPKKVAIICNHNNGSADEQFLITAKQNQKVKVFGHPTGGMLDISNVNEIDSPDGKFTLAYSMSRSYRIPNYCIDGVGIQPDYYIDEDISEYDWVEYTRSILEN
jgi:C-terminal processing protease CtpA/Prc